MLGEYLRDDKPTLHACFVLGPEYRYDPELIDKGDCYGGTFEVDAEDFKAIYDISTQHIKKLGKSKNGKLKCYYNAWVCFRPFFSDNILILYLFIKI